MHYVQLSFQVFKLGQPTLFYEAKIEEMAKRFLYCCHEISFSFFSYIRKEQVSAKLLKSCEELHQFKITQHFEFFFIKIYMKLISAKCHTFKSLNSHMLIPQHCYLFNFVLFCCFQVLNKDARNFIDFVLKAHLEKTQKMCLSLTNNNRGPI